jgi:wyosine [tRNA(Phe)-imidazoG37] synthetase (radical SAM superfamily)
MERHVFGPVPSRRLGISLGVDIIPYKTCTLDCLYCECGKTTHLVTTRASFVDREKVLKEVADFLKTDQFLDIITFSGSGEPTLNQDIGWLMNEFKKITAIPIAVLTNGTLLHRSDVCQDLLSADLVLPSLDAASQSVFCSVNKPHESLKIDSIINGLVEFRKQYQGQIWLEVFILKGLNDHPAELDKIYQAILRIKPDKVQLNSLDRPPAYPECTAMTAEELQQIVHSWSGVLVEVIKRVERRQEIKTFSQNLENSILNTIARRPLLIDDLQALTGKHPLELIKYLDILEKEKKIVAKVINDKIFYCLKKS